MKKLTREFFERKPELVAKELLGKLLIRQKDNQTYIGKIVETEAYLGIGDKASHSYKGMTKRNEVMFGPGGFSYVYFTYGMHWLLNFITEEEGKPSGVLIRAVEPVYCGSLRGNKVDATILAPDRHASARDDIIKRVGSGPAKLTKWMEITGELNKADVTKSNELFVADEIKICKQLFKSEKVPKTKIAAAPRLGVDYAGEHKDLQLRFYIKENDFVSKN